MRLREDGEMELTTRLACATMYRPAAAPVTSEHATSAAGNTDDPFAAAAALMTSISATGAASNTLDLTGDDNDADSTTLDLPFDQAVFDLDWPRVPAPDNTERVVRTFDQDADDVPILQHAGCFIYEAHMQQLLDSHWFGDELVNWAVFLARRVVPPAVKRTRLVLTTVQSAALLGGWQFPSRHAAVTEFVIPVCRANEHFYVIRLDLVKRELHLVDSLQPSVMHKDAVAIANAIVPDVAWKHVFDVCVRQRDAHSCGPITCYHVWLLAQGLPVNDLSPFESGLLTFESLRLSLAHSILLAIRFYDVDNDASSVLSAPVLMDPMDLPAAERVVAILRPPVDDDMINAPHLVRIEGPHASVRWLLLTTAQLRLAPMFNTRLQPLIRDSKPYILAPLSDRIRSVVHLAASRLPTCSPLEVEEIMDLFLNRMPIYSMLKHGVFDDIKDLGSRYASQMLKDSAFPAVAAFTDLRVVHTSNQYTALMSAVADASVQIRTDATIGPLIHWLDTVGTVASSRRCRRSDITCGLTNGDWIANLPERCSIYDPTLQTNECMVHLYGLAAPVVVRDLLTSLDDGLFRSVALHDKAAAGRTASAGESHAQLSTALRMNSSWVTQRTQYDEVAEVLFFMDMPLQEFERGTTADESGLVFVRFTSLDNRGLPRYGWTIPNELPPQMFKTFLGRQRAAYTLLGPCRSVSASDAHIPLSTRYAAYVQAELAAFAVLYATGGELPHDGDLTRLGPVGPLARINDDTRGWAMDLALSCVIMDNSRFFAGATYVPAKIAPVARMFNAMYTSLARIDQEYARKTTQGTSSHLRGFKKDMPYGKSCRLIRQLDAAADQLFEPADYSSDEEDDDPDLAAWCNANAVPDSDDGAVPAQLNEYRQEKDESDTAHVAARFEPTGTATALYEACVAKEEQDEEEEAIQRRAWGLHFLPSSDSDDSDDDYPVVRRVATKRKRVLE